MQNWGLDLDSVGLVNICNRISCQSKIALRVESDGKPAESSRNIVKCSGRKIWQNTFKAGEKQKSFLILQSQNYPISPRLKVFSVTSKHNSWLIIYICLYLYLYISHTYMCFLKIWVQLPTFYLLPIMLDMISTFLSLSVLHKMKETATFTPQTCHTNK